MWQDPGLTWHNLTTLSWPSHSWLHKVEQTPIVKVKRNAGLIMKQLMMKFLDHRRHLRELVEIQHWQQQPVASEFRNNITKKKNWRHVCLLLVHPPHDFTKTGLLSYDIETKTVWPLYHLARFLHKSRAFTDAHHKWSCCNLNSTWITHRNLTQNFNY